MSCQLSIGEQARRSTPALTSYQLPLVIWCTIHTIRRRGWTHKYRHHQPTTTPLDRESSSTTMCTTSTARRRSLTLQLMPSHFLSSTAEAVPSSNDSACIEQPTVQHKSAPSPSMKEGLIIHHDYHDHATSPPLPVDASTIKRPAKGGVVTPFRKSVLQVSSQRIAHAHPAPIVSA